VVQQLARDRLNACDILADSLRNAITKSGLVFTLIKQEVGFLREQWEQVLREHRNEKDFKIEAIERLNALLSSMNGDHQALREDLVEVQKRFLTLQLPPDKGRNWVTLQIEERWRNLLSKGVVLPEGQGEVWKAIDLLKKSLGFGREPEVIGDYNMISDDMKQEWVDVIYREDDHFDSSDLEKIINILEHSAMKIPSQAKSRKTLVQLKAIAETVKQLEQNTNFLLRQVLNGGNHNGNGGSTLDASAGAAPADEASGHPPGVSDDSR
jgi:hypothetical protein